MSGIVQTASWVGAGVTFLAVLAALLRDEIRRAWKRPVLTVSLKQGPPDCHMTRADFTDRNTGALLASGDCYYFRIWVENKGNIRADTIQVFAAKLWKKYANGEFKVEDDFLPMNLRWSHGIAGSNQPEIFAAGISPQMGKHCDLGHIYDPVLRAKIGQSLKGASANETIMALDLEVEPNTNSHLLAPGTYRILLKVAAANVKPVSLTIEISLTGYWDTDEAQMFAKGIGLRII